MWQWEGKGRGVKRRKEVIMHMCIHMSTRKSGGITYWIVKKRLFSKDDEEHSILEGMM